MKNTPIQSTARNFTSADVSEGKYGSIYADRSELIDAPLPWQEMGLQQTASGYGRKLTSRYKVQFEGKAYRLYTTCFSNVGSTFFTVKGRIIYVN